MSLDLFQFVVGVVGIVVEQGQPARASYLSNLHSFNPSTVSPCPPRFFLLGCELGVMDQQIGLLGQFYDAWIQAVVGMVHIGGINDDFALATDAIAKGASRMGQSFGQNRRPVAGDDFFPVVNFFDKQICV